MLEKCGEVVQLSGGTTDATTVIKCDTKLPEMFPCELVVINVNLFVVVMIIES